jgi:hypothetical protein
MRTMRTAQQERARFTWLRPAQVAAELQCDDDTVRQHIHNGDFPDVDGEPGVIDIGTGNVPQYRINPESFRLYRQAARVSPKGAAA